MIRVSYDEMVSEIERVLLASGFGGVDARDLAGIFADSSRDGVHSHGLHRLPRFVENVADGVVRVGAMPERLLAFGAMERWDGRLGPGPLNARFAMERAVHLAKEAGIGLVALQNTNHWMRGGTYGWQAADMGVMGLCWSNTKSNLPAWGGTDPRLGNNPLVVAVPRDGGAHVVLDMAMSQFSYGQIASHAAAGRSLPVDGGYDREGRPTRDPAEIERTQRALPIGFWKGSGLSLVLDLLAAVLSGGKAVHEVADVENELCQVFLAVDPAFGGASASVRTGGASTSTNSSIVERVLEHLHDSTPVREGEDVTYPGERTWHTRQDSLANGVSVRVDAWERVRGLMR